MSGLLSPRQQFSSTSRTFLGIDSEVAAEMLSRELFTKMLCLERNRVERSGRRFVLLLLDCKSLLKRGQTATVEKIQRGLSRITRSTDIKGWYQEDATIGVVFTEIPMAETSVVRVLSRRVAHELHSVVGPEFDEVELSFHLFPEDSDGEDRGIPGPGTFSTIYPDLRGEIESRRLQLIAKRCLDVVGSSVALLLLAPLMIMIAIAVKLTSSGPALFRQKRLGQSGKSFPFLKFRSMYAKADSAIHEAYIKQFIANRTESAAQPGSDQVFKLQTDPRITRIGRILRRTSLDELPQFFSVLVGHMSLVGPRPPLPYEFAAYEVWHCRRLLAVKPGITGYWQIEGRSRVKFDEMVRMDIRYARTWSLWKDIKILWRTPRAVVSGNGAC